jgi:hypothetical protein
MGRKSTALAGVLLAAAALAAVVTLGAPRIKVKSCFICHSDGNLGASLHCKVALLMLSCSYFHVFAAGNADERWKS